MSTMRLHPSATVLATFVALALLATPASAQLMRSGDVEVVLVNPDLVPAADGSLHVSGDFMGQIVLRGNRSGDVREVTLSFAPGPSVPEHTPLFPGLHDYRIDDTAGDGWLVPIGASDQQDGQYAFAVHAYTTPGNPSTEVGRVWGSAFVENGGGDRIAPWPWILPGETAEFANPHGVQGVTIEFGEEATAQLWVNGVEASLTEWTPPARDSDDLPRETVETRVYGSGYKWEGVVTRGDLLRVTATDAAGNTVTKGVLVGHGVDVPAIELVAPEVHVSALRGGTASYSVTATNHGLQPATVALFDDMPLDWPVELSTASFTLDPRASSTFDVSVMVPARAPVAVYDWSVRAEYAVGTENVAFVLPLRVEAGPGDGAGGPGTGDDGDDEDTVANPLPVSVAPALTAVAAAALAARRWRHP